MIFFCIFFIYTFKNIHSRGELHCVVSHKSVLLFPICQEHQRPVNDTSDMSGIPHSCFGCVSQSASLQTVRLKLSKAKFWLKNGFSVSKTTWPDFWQSGNKKAGALKLCTVRDLVASARKGFMKKVHRMPLCQDLPGTYVKSL